MKPILNTILVLTAAIVLAVPAVAKHQHHRGHRHHHRSIHTVASKGVAVWVNTNSGVYHYAGERWYGNTKVGKYISEDAAKAEGDRATENGQ